MIVRVTNIAKRSVVAVDPVPAPITAVLYRYNLLMQPCLF